MARASLPREARLVSSFLGPQEVAIQSVRARLARNGTRIVIVLGLLLILAFLVGFGLFPQSVSLRITRHLLEKYAGPGSSVASVQVRPLLLSADFSDLVLVLPGQRITVARGHLALSPRTLTGGGFQARSLELDSLRIELSPSPAPMPAAGAPPATALPSLRIGSLRVRDGSALWTGENGSALSLEGIRADGALGEGVLTLDVASGTWKNGRTITFGPARTRIATSPAWDLELLPFELASDMGHLSARGHLLREARLAPDLVMEVLIDLDGAGRVLAEPSLGGRLAAHGQFDLRNGQPRLDLRIDGEAAWDEQRLRGLVARLRADGEGTNLELSASYLGGRVSGEARVSGGTTSGSLQAQGLRPDGLVPGLGPSDRADAHLAWSGPLDGWIATTLTVDGTAVDWPNKLAARVSGGFDPRDASARLEWTLRVDHGARGAASLPVEIRASGTLAGVPSRLVATVSGSAALRPPLPSESELTAVSFGGRLEKVDARSAFDLSIGGGLGEHTVVGAIAGTEIEHLVAHGSGIDLSIFGAGTTGTARLEASGEGPLRRPRFVVKIDAEELTWREARIGGLTAAAKGDSRRATIALDLPDLRITENAEYIAQPFPHLVGTLELRSTPLEPLSRWLPSTAPLDGEVTATLRHETPVHSLVDSTASLTLESAAVRLGNRTLSIHPFVASLAERRVRLDGFHVESAGASVEIEGGAGLGPNDPLELEIRASGDASAVSPVGDWTLGGRLHAEMGVGGTRTRPVPGGHLSLEDVSATPPDGSTLPPLRVSQASIRLTPEAFEIPPLTASIGGGTGALHGRLPYAALFRELRSSPPSAAERADIELSWSGVTFPRFPGELEGVLRVTGGLSNLREVVATLEIPATRLRLEGVAVELLPSTVTLAQGRLATDGVRLHTEEGDFVAAGSLSLEDRTLDLTGKGRLALAALSPLLPETSLSGSADLDLSITGSLDAPLPNGTLSVDNVALRSWALPEALTGMRGKATFERGTLTLDGNGSLGGGSVHLGGEVRSSKRALDAFDLSLEGHDVALSYPPGLRSRLHLGLTLTGQRDALTLSGNVEVRSGTYDLETALRDAVTSAARQVTESPLLRSIRLDMGVVVDRPVLIRSNFGTLRATGRIDARGDLQDPAPFGRLELIPRQRLIIQGREFELEEGSISYSGDWNAALSLRAKASIEATEELATSETYEVELSLAGTLTELRATLRSEPMLSQGKIVSLIATGRLTSNTADASAWLLGGQAATLLGRRLATTFSLDEITIRPDLIGQETDPSARFTFGKRLNRNMRVVYSAGLGGPETRFVDLQVMPAFGLNLSAQRTDAGSYTLGAGQRFEWGAARSDAERRESRVALREVRFLPSPPPDADWREVMGLGIGKKVDGLRIERSAEKLRRRLRQDGHIEAEVTGRLEGDLATYSVEAGPVYHARVTGMGSPPDLTRELRRALFEADAIELSRARLRQVLTDRGYLRASVTSSVESTNAGAARTLIFSVKPGDRFGSVEVRFPGARALGEKELLTAAGGAATLLTTPDAATRRLRDAYRQRLFLAASVSPPEITLGARSASIVVPIDEGPCAHLLSVSFEGTSLPEDTLRRVADVELSSCLAPEDASAAATRVRNHYLSLGYALASVRPRTKVDGSDLALVLEISEGKQLRIATVELEGNTRTREWLVRRALRLPPGTLLDPRRLSQAESRLHALGTLSRVAVVPSSKDPTRVNVVMKEGPLLSAGYDLRWNDEDGWSALVQGGTHNILGLGVDVAGRFRVGSTERESRAMLRIPSTLAGGDIVGSVFLDERDFPEADATRTQKGFQIQHNARIASSLDLLTGYRFRRNLTEAPGLITDPIDIAGLDVSLVRATWDDLLDPLRGGFLSINLNYAPAALGSDAPMAKGFAQASLARSFLGGSLTWAQSYRLGLGFGLDGEPLRQSERFEAGGASSLRGFATNSLGELDPLGDPAGGQAVVIVNQELRLRHASGLGGAVFYDIGNTFAKPRDLTLDLRHSLGAGVRYASPVGLLRVDIGFPLERRAGEKGYRIFFGLGQAF